MKTIGKLTIDEIRGALGPLYILIDFAEDDDYLYYAFFRILIEKDFLLYEVTPSLELDDKYNSTLSKMWNNHCYVLAIEAQDGDTNWDDLKEVNDTWESDMFDEPEEEFSFLVKKCMIEFDIDVIAIYV